MADYDVKVLEISKGGNTYTYDAGGTHYAVCDTAAGTQTKAVTISEIASLTTGLSVRIKFSNAQTYNGQPKLQINSLTATNIVRMGTTAAAQYEWNAGEVLDFVYDGTNFIIQEGAVPTTTYYGGRIKLSSATNSTSEVLAATPKAVKAAYDLANGKASTSVATQSANGLMSSTDKTKLDGIATGATANVGTITGITMNGASKGTSGVVNLGTVLTSHQDISSKANRDEIGIVITGNTASQNVTSGQYVIVRSSTISGISDGLYTASANVSAGTAFTSANLTTVSNGGLNSLNEHLEYKTNTEVECGTWDGKKLYRQVVSGKKTDTNWGSVAALSGINTQKIVHFIVQCADSNLMNICAPYYVSSSDLFRAAVQSGYLYAQLGTSYPAHSGSGATISAVIYYTKD